MNLLPILDRAHGEPDGIALSSDGMGRATWHELTDAIMRLAGAIRDADLGPDRRLMVVSRNRPSAAVAHAAALLGGAAAVPVNFHLTAGEIQYQVDESRAGLVFADSATYPAVAEAIAGRDVPVVRLPDHGIGGELAAFAAGHGWIELHPEQRVIPNLLFTSGTTGRPKAVQLPPATIGPTPDLAGFATYNSAQQLAQFGPHLMVGPMYHNGPLTAVRLLLAGVPLVIHGSFDAEKTLATIQEQRIEATVMVPTHFVRILALPEEVRRSCDVSSLRCVIHTGGPCPVEVKRAMIDWWGPVLFDAYGGTESGPTCTINSEDWLAHPGSVGRAVPPFEALILDEDGTELPVGTEGRLYFRDTTGRGIRYEGDPEKTAAAHIAPGVFTLGEIGKLDEDGFVYITDRFSDMVVSGGVNIYPAEAEQALQRHPAVHDVACIGVPDREMGERLVAVVQLNPGVAVTAAELDAHARQTLAGYKCPKQYHLVETIPRNAMGKLDKRSLKAAYREHGS